MSKSQMTPGPWKVAEQTPCRVDTPEGSISIDWRSTDGTYDAKAEANARAIAALPELVEALRSLLDVANTTSDDAWLMLERPCQKASAVLAKLEGGEA